MGEVANTGNTQQMGQEEQCGVCVVTDVRVSLPAQQTQGKTEQPRPTKHLLSQVFRI